MIAMRSEQFMSLLRQIGFYESGFCRYLEIESRYEPLVKEWAEGRRKIPKYIAFKLIQINTLFFEEAARIVAEMQQEKIFSKKFIIYFEPEDFLRFDPDNHRKFNGNYSLYKEFIYGYLPRRLAAVGCKCEYQDYDTRPPKQLLAETIEQFTNVFLPQQQQKYRNMVEQARARYNPVNQDPLPWQNAAIVNLRKEKILRRLREVYQSQEEFSSTTRD